MFKPKRILFLFLLSGLIVLSASLFSLALVAATVQTMEKNMRNHIAAVARWGAQLVTAEELARYRTPEDMALPQYQALRLRLAAFAEQNGVVYIYYFREEKGRVQYIVDNDFDEATRVGLDSPSIALEVMPAKAASFLGREVFAGLDGYAPEWPNVIAGYQPMRDAAGNVAAVCGVDIDDADLQSVRVQMRVLTAVHIFSVAAVFVIGLVCMMFYRRESENAIQSNLSKRRFLSRMSHELRTPMTAILGLSEIELQNHLPPATLDNLDKIYTSGSILLSIVNNMLDISKMEADSFELNPTEYDTPNLLNDTMRMNLVRLGSKPIAFHLEIAPDFPLRLVGDELRIKQILNNLLSNALKYTHAGQVTLHTAWAPAAEGVEVIFTVSDTGAGIPSEYLPHIFSEAASFDRKTYRTSEGSGFGLALTKRFAELMGGTVTAESEYGRGSRFTARLRQGIPPGGLQRVGDEVADNLRQFRFIGKQDLKAQHLARSYMPYGRVLVVDDVATNLHVAKGLLLPYGLTVDLSEKGQDAVDRIRDEKVRYDLVLMDHMMPDLDGVEATRAIRALPTEYARALPIVALTANTLLGSEEMFLRNGFDGFLSKPVDILRLDATLNRWIRDKQDPETLRAAAEAAESRKAAAPVALSPRLLAIEGLDAEQGATLAGGTEERYLEVLALYRKDVEARRAYLDQPEGKLFVTHVHALKSASANIGAAELAEEAALLEAAGKRGDLDFIREQLAGFCARLAAMTEAIAALSGPAAPPEPLDPQALARLRAALEAEDVAAAQNLLDALQAAHHNPPALEAVADHLLLFDLQEAAEAVARLEETLGAQGAGEK